MLVNVTNFSKLAKQNVMILIWIIESLFFGTI